MRNCITSLYNFMEDFPKTEIQKLRAAMWAELYKKDMPLSEVWKIQDQIRKKYPVTEEERRLKTESLKRMPEFVL